MIRSTLLFIAGVAVGFGLGCGFFVLTNKSAVSQNVAPPIAQRTPRSLTVMVGVQTLFKVVKERPDSVSAVLLTMTGSAVELNNGIRLYAETLDRQPELGEAAKEAGLPSAIE